MQVKPHAAAVTAATRATAPQSRVAATTPSATRPTEFADLLKNAQAPAAAGVTGSASGVANGAPNGASNGAFNGASNGAPTASSAARPTAAATLPVDTTSLAARG